MPELSAAIIFLALRNLYWRTENLHPSKPLLFRRECLAMQVAYPSGIKSTAARPARPLRGLGPTALCSFFWYDHRIPLRLVSLSFHLTVASSPVSYSRFRRFPNTQSFELSLDSVPTRIRRHKSASARVTILVETL
ncbi:hypothetical protein B0H12DRAFT_1143704 [Mycena haematopus]|nr:hypothetical protein B0H12DRAFT_1145341 [Mycena haematopus]KAJ7233619.1 hypothetical protein B0H12DRAFT_1143704 [Mycena haematopus]